MKPHRGINTSSIAGGGLEGLPGIVFTIAFVLIFIFISAPSYASNWVLLWFLIIEGIACGIYFVSKRRERKATYELQQMLHRLNETDKK